jgi:protein arginine kinase
MDLTDFLIGPAAWTGLGKSEDVKPLSPVICTVASIHRNFADNKFPCVGDAENLRNTEKKSALIFKNLGMKRGIKISDIQALDYQMLQERFMVPGLVNNEGLGVSGACLKSASLFLGQDHDDIYSLTNAGESLSIYSQFRSMPEIALIDNFLNRLQGEFNDKWWALDKKIGHLFADPFLAGTGFRLLSLVHFPGISIIREWEQLINALNAMGLRHFEHPHLAGQGNLVWVYSKTAIGDMETKIYQAFRTKLNKVLQIEASIQARLYSKDKGRIEDKVYRSLALLGHARLLSYTELLELSSWVKLGCYLGLVSGRVEAAINTLMVKTGPGHIQLGESQILKEDAADLMRGAISRQLIREFERED